MDHDLVELVEAARVVEVPVRGDGDDRPLEQVRQLSAERGQAQAGVHEEIAVASADEVQVGAEERVHVGLDDPHDVVVDRLVREPSLRDLHAKSLTRSASTG
jgi:hypothetical protein